jgi:general secretion pathway protein G
MAVDVVAHQLTNMHRLIPLKSKFNAGFTLLELLVVLVIIGLLASYVGPKYFAQIGKSEVTVARAQIDSLAKAVETFRLDVGRYPSAEEGLGALSTRPDNASGWNGPYLKKAVPLDPWQRPFVYALTIPSGDFSIISYGKDGKPGGIGDNADLSN